MSIALKQSGLVCACDALTSGPPSKQSLAIQECVQNFLSSCARAPNAPQNKQDGPMLDQHLFHAVRPSPNQRHLGIQDIAHNYAFAFAIRLLML
jgi:hypothetical protein